MFDRKRDDIVISRRQWESACIMLEGNLLHYSIDFRVMVGLVKGFKEKLVGTQYELVDDLSPLKVLEFVSLRFNV